jgi:large conductance mechanosensitive channel
MSFFSKKETIVLKEFRDFALKGNVIDLAVAVIIGIAFGAVVLSLVNDIIMPIIGVLLGGVDFATLSIQVGDAMIMYGKFIQAIVNFLIIAWVLFLVIKAANRMRMPAAPPGPSAQEMLLTEIRDLLKTR